MDYATFVEVYDRLSSTSKKIEKIGILAEFLKRLQKEESSEWIYLLRGKVTPDYDSRELGISTQLTLKAMSASFGVSQEKIIADFNEAGDIGEIAERYSQKRRQRALFMKKLDVKKVFDNLKMIISIEGKGAVDRKISLISELLTSAAPKEAKYIVRTLLSDLRVGVADALLIDAIAEAFFVNEDDAKQVLEEKYHLANDFSLLFDAARKGMLALGEIDLVPGRPVSVMLAVKADTLEEAFRICGTPAAAEYKYDGFRMLINKRGEDITLFTRRLENVTSQFPDVVSAARKYISAKEYVLDAEVVGYDLKTKKYLPFEAISQRIKRKYDIDKLAKTLPVEINIFDVLYHDGKNTLDTPYLERRKIVEKIVKTQALVIRPAVQKIVEDEEEAEVFYQSALDEGEEGIMMKKLDAPYRQGRKVGYMVKIKPTIADLDLVIVGAEYGTGKRGGWLTSYIVACKDGEEFLEIGKVSSGLKEKKENDGQETTYEEMTKLLRPLIISEKDNQIRVRPEIVIAVTYQNIQESPSYSSEYALRFPRITRYRPDKKPDEIATLSEIKKEVKKQR
ncbi:ATP-dependent DNA ligase [Candidatus Pacearchaeota archaeon]|nr:ATP-dependent DNA ligase [Candidatus Pacearchaeota archaeon]